MSFVNKGINDLTKQQYQTLFHADFENGQLYRKDQDGEIGAMVNVKPLKSGYRQMGLRWNNRRFLTYVHRVLYIMAHGSIDGDVWIDHINGDRTDDRITNLRAIDARINGPRRPSTSGFPGVHRFAPRNKWRATLRHNGKTYHLGHFDDPLEGYKAYRCKFFEVHGEYPLDDEQHLNKHN